MTRVVAARSPINLLEAGPLGCVIGAAAVGARIGEDNLITLDIGGTTAKASLVERGALQLTGNYHIDGTPATAGYPVKVPVVDIVEIGAGGGSIAWFDPAGALRVGRGMRRRAGPHLLRARRPGADGDRRESDSPAGSIPGTSIEAVACNNANPPPHGKCGEPYV